MAIRMQLVERQTQREKAGKYVPNICTSRGDATTPLQFRFGGAEVLLQSACMRRLIGLVEQIAKSKAAILVQGETGSGKEIIARAIHHFSQRADRPFVDLNCAALPEHLIESELFGYEKGAFSGATAAKPGLFELADTGTLFLDEIGELDPKLQAKLLRVVDGASFYRLGGSRKISVDVRIVSATNQNIESLIAAQRFRHDLFHRLAQFELHVPPLRERPEDIEAIAQHTLNEHLPDCRLANDALAALRNYPWPGNVRELKNVLLKVNLLFASGKSEIHAIDLPPQIRNCGNIAQTPVSRRNLSELEKRTIFECVDAHPGDLTAAAGELGISRRTLERKLKSYEEAATPTLGVMSPAQQRRFRAPLDSPVRIRYTDGSELEASAMNISCAGLGIQVPQAVRDERFSIRFQVPGCDSEVEAQAELAWAEPSGRCGLRLLEVASAGQTAIQRFLFDKMQAEGWTVPVNAKLGDFPTEFPADRKSRHSGCVELD